ncbi:MULTISPECIES: hypothetical protein [unclassified Colwellia]|jgi:hypothetical protein|uniref:hypothetical protein n=1 Tax=unclassified Colwellia TaxID=196834 RepID=UPI0015F55D99|nr:MULTISPECIES: hypothetical protein [unclassified Colwellia]MBA6256435.1 hypothetical protein [Colwellia sp. MB3u-28]MBA6260362.1 hypothetical protein [Colwellia sp. MB3u-41]
MTTKFIKFEFKSSDIDQYSLIIQKSNDDDFHEEMVSNPHTFSLESDVEYVYMLRVVGNSGDKCELVISGASKARTPVKRKINAGQNSDTYLDLLIA